MTPNPPVDPELQEFLDAEADAYLASLPLEHFMESTAQATQRTITLESFDLVRTIRPEVQCFNELLIQFPRGKRQKPGKVVPDNFVLVHPTRIDALKSFNLHTQPVRPLLVMEYVSKENRRKDYEDNFDTYQELGFPYYLLFYADNEELTLFRLGSKGYTAVAPNAAGRVAVPELELEAGLLGGWVRYWFRGELLPLPGDLLIERDAAREQRDDAKKQRDDARQQLDAERTARLAAEAELAELREELARVKKQQP